MRGRIDFRLRSKRSNAMSASRTPGRSSWCRSGSANAAEYADGPATQRLQAVIRVARSRCSPVQEPHSEPQSFLLSQTGRSGCCGRQCTLRGLGQCGRELICWHRCAGRRNRRCRTGPRALLPTRAGLLGARARVLRAGTARVLPATAGLLPTGTRVRCAARAGLLAGVKGGTITIATGMIAADGAIGTEALNVRLARSNSSWVRRSRRRQSRPSPSQPARCTASMQICMFSSCSETHSDLETFLR